MPVADAGCEELTLILDDWSALLAGQDGATVDPASVADNASEEPIANGFGGNLDVPAPGASPVFTTALGILG